jgi:hypothetical protein
MAAKQRNPATIGLAGKSGRKGGPARAARLAPEQFSENTRKAASARRPRSGNGSSGDARGSKPAISLGTSKQALHACLKRLKAAKDESEIRRLADELQRIVFRKQYRNAEN